MIDNEGRLAIGPRGSSIPSKAARFKYFEVNDVELRSDATTADTLFAGSGQTIVVPVPSGVGSGTVAFDVVLSHEGLPPSGTQVNFELTPAAAGYHLRAAREARIFR